MGPSHNISLILEYNIYAYVAHHQNEVFEKIDCPIVDINVPKNHMLPGKLTILKVSHRSMSKLGPEIAKGVYCYFPPELPQVSIFYKSCMFSYGDLVLIAAKQSR